MRASNRTRAIARALGALALCAAAAFAADATDRAIFEHIHEITTELTRISGLPMRHAVPSDFITRDKVKAFLQGRIQEVAKPEEIRAEELTLKKFGLVPQDFDLAKTTVDLLTEQAAAFYDFNKKRLFITDWTASDSREMALAHELAHALADQSFNLKKYIQQGQKSDDGAMARLAVMEGQASWLMADYLAERMGQSLDKSPALLETMARAMAADSGQFPVFQNAPLYMRRTLLFPYADGMMFQNAVFERMGKQAFAEVFRHPPVSTQQVLHVDRYFAGVKPDTPALPAVALKGFKPLVEGSIGELDHSILIEQYEGKAASEQIAPHWKGGFYRLWERRAPERIVLGYAAEWDEAAVARRYFELYRDVLKKKWKTMRVDAQGADWFAGQGDDGYFLVRLEAARVTSLEGLESPAPAPRTGIRHPYE